MKRTPLLLAVIGLGLLAGCARFDIGSEVSESGSVERSVKMTLSTQNMGPEEEDIDPRTILKLTNPADWKTAVSRQDMDQVFSATRTYKDAPKNSKEFTLTDGQTEGTTCTVTVTKEGKRIIYRETHTWTGPPAKKGPPMDEAKKILKESLPAGALSDEKTNALAELLAKDAWRIVFGPSQPILGDMLANPSLGMRRLRMRMGEKMMERLKEAAPNMSEEARLKTVQTFGQKFSDIQYNQTEGPDQEGNSLLVTLDCSVKGPGKLVSTNGEHDIISGRVYWSFAMDAATIEPVVLEAIYELP